MFRKTHLSSCITIAWILSSALTRGAVAAPWCDQALDLEPNSAGRETTHLEQLTDRSTYRWQLPSTGIATVDLLADGSIPAWSTARADACGERAAEAWVLEQSSSHLVLAVKSPGYLYLKVGSGAAKFRRVTSFTEAEVAERAIPFGDRQARAVETRFLVAGPIDKTEPEVVDPDPDGLTVGDRASTLKTEPEVVDPDPDGLVAGKGRLVASFLTIERASPVKTEPEVVDPDPDGLMAGGRVLGLKTEPEVVDPDPDGLNGGDWGARLKTEPEVVDPDPDGISVDSVSDSWWGLVGAVRQVLAFEPICRPAEDDDHGDTASCATPLTLGPSVSGGHSVVGEIANDWEDDRDVFSFQLSEVSRVEIALVAEAAGLTYDLSGPNGQLAVEELRTEAATEAHLVTTLAPGRYFFRVAGASGAYAITAMTYD